MGEAPISELLGSPWIWLALAPLVLAACTAFTKVVIVLGALRLGLSARELLPYGVIVALALLVTAIIMGPVATDMIWAVGASEGIVDVSTASWNDLSSALAPLRDFLALHASEDELIFFAELSGRPLDDPQVQVLAFLVTELGEALHVAVLILLPFVIIDLLLAEVLTLVGVPQVPVATVALPAKILLFLGAGGWDIIIGGLVEAYA